MINQHTFGSLFSGIGGIDLGLERAGWTCKWQVENNQQCRNLLAERWPHVTRYSDIRDFKRDDYVPVALVCGGDPCPKHSKARSNGQSKSPDLSGYFLAVVGRLRPRWVVRENVLAPTVEHFATALELLGYGVAIVRINAASFVAQQRIRDFVIGCYQASGDDLAELFRGCDSGSGPSTKRLGSQSLVPCLTTHRTRYDTAIVTFGKNPGSESWTVTSEKPLPDSLVDGLLDFLKQHAPECSETP